METKKQKFYCNTCIWETNHTILKHHKEYYEETIYFEDANVGEISDLLWSNDIYQIIKCNWCDQISFRETSINSECTNKRDIEENFYPKRNVNQHKHKKIKQYRKTLKIFI